jgi:membrane-associated phospholipid phosphatase
MRLTRESAGRVGKAARGSEPAQEVEDDRLTSKRTGILTALLLCVAMSCSLQAQQNQNEKPVPEPVFSLAHDVGTVVHRFPHDQWAIYTSPLHMGRQPHLWRYIAPLAVGAAFIAADKHLSANLPKGHGGRSATIANIGLDGTAATAGVFYFTGLARHNDHERETGMLAGESLLNSVIPHAALSMLFGRRRPYQGGPGEVGEGDFFARHSASASFPSGHSMYTWAMASTFANEYPSVPSRLLWYTVATTVTVSRVTGREHFASDVIVGGAIGYMIAKRIYRHRHAAE